MLKTVKEREEAKNYKYLFCLTRSLGTRVIPRPPPVDIPSDNINMSEETFRS